MKKKLILRCFMSPGDIVTMTAAVRDLHRIYPNRFLTDVRTTAMQLWEGNPFITHVDDGDPDAEIIKMEYPLIHKSNTTPRHFIEGYTAFLSERIGVPLWSTEFRGDVYIRPEEKNWISQVHEIVGSDVPFWIICAGIKRDYTAKAWIWRRWQEVVDRLRDRILFVQVGETKHVHPPLRGVIDLRGKTDVRQLVRLVYHSAGVVCHVTFLMHLAAAVPMKRTPPLNRPCVVIAGGREPTQWEMYPHHRFLNTNGCLPCCDNGGCWKSRVVPLNDGSDHDKSLCVNPVVIDGVTAQKCMDMISVEDVVRAIESYYSGGVLRWTDVSRFAKYLSV